MSTSINFLSSDRHKILFLNLENRWKKKLLMKCLYKFAQTEKLIYFFLMLFCIYIYSQTSTYVMEIQLFYLSIIFYRNIEIFSNRNFYAKIRNKMLRIKQSAYERNLNALHVEKSLSFHSITTHFYTTLVLIFHDFLF